MATTLKTQKPAFNLDSKSSLKMKEFLNLCISKWWWFVISIVVCMGIAFYIYKTTTPTYTSSASILIKTDAQGRSISQSASIFQDLSISTGNSTIHDEVAMLKSPDLMRDVVRKLNLATSYTRKGKFRPIDIYGSELPVIVKLPDLKEEQTASFTITVNPNGDYTLTNLVLNGKKLNNDDISGRVGTIQKTPFGRLEVLPGEKFNSKEPEEINVSKNTVKGVAAALGGALTVNTDETSYNIVNITVTNSSRQRSLDIVSQLIASYNDRWIQEKRTLADNSSKFIDERVQLLQTELGSVDNDISSFKSSNLVPDVDAAASLYMSQATQANITLTNLRNQEYMAKYIRNYLRNAENVNKLLPANTGLANTSLASQIGQYNSKVLERNSLVAQSSTSNPLVLEMDRDLAALRGALVASIDNELMALNEQIRSQEGFSGNATSKIASNPKQARYLLSVERQQKVKESLYLYLLQKREENQLNQAFTSYNTRVIREADGPGGPIAPNGTNILLFGFVIGLALPAVALFGKECMVHVVRGRKDIENMQTPFAGEIPLSGKKQKLSKPSYKGQESTPLVTVKENSRNSVNEAFRVVRTNVEFMLGTDPACKVVMLTSANPGSGKTFVTYNLAKTFAIKGKRVVMLDLDMRKAALSKYISGVAGGVSDYLAGKINDISKVTHSADDCPTLSVIPVGTIPPNPSELLFTERFRELLDNLKVHYDYVFLDCPPVEVVADASIISKFSDYTLFVIRAGLLDLSMLSVIDGYYANGSYPNMSVILNGTLNPRSKYARKYSSPNSFGYGYGYGYHYADD